MAKNTQVDETDQQTLVPMSEEEVKEAGHKLAKKVKELEDLQAEHKELKDDMRAKEKRVKGEISAIASTLRTQGR
jgi:hypothetical protein